MDFTQKISYLLLFLLSGTVLFASMEEVHLCDPQHENSFVMIKNNTIDFTLERGNATTFRLQNLADIPSDAISTLGVTPYHIIAPDGRYLNVHNGTLVLAPFNQQESQWHSVIHYQYWNQLKNQGYQLERFVEYEKALR